MSSSQRSGKLPVPLGACDSHCHVFGPLDQYPISPLSGYDPPFTPLDAYLAQVEPLGIERFVFVQPSAYADDNRYLLESLSKVGAERGRGVVEIDEGNFSKEQLLEWGSLGVRGLRVQVHAKTEDQEVARDFLRRVELQVDIARDLGWFVDFLTPLWLTKHLLPSLHALDIPFAVPHFGLHSGDARRDRGVFDELLSLAATGRRDCWLKVSGYYRISADPEFRDVAELFGQALGAAPDRLLWGSDYPQLVNEDRISTAELFALFESWVPSTTAFDSILVENPSVFFGF